MAFGINRKELKQWKEKVKSGDIAFLTHYWVDDRFPGCHTVTKVGCANLEKLFNWGRSYGLRDEWVHKREKFPHYDLFGDIQKNILKKERLFDHIQRFNL